MPENSEIVYHYTSMDSFLKIIEGCSLHFTHARYLNDSKKIIWLRECIDNLLEKEDFDIESEQNILYLEKYLL